MMRGISACLIFGLICCVQYSVSSKGNYLPFSHQKIPPKTPGPININTTAVKFIFTKPLVIAISLTDVVTLHNTGYSVEVILKSPKTSCSVFGGVLNGFYIFSRQKFFFTSIKGEVAGTTVNGKFGARLEISLYYYNSKYGSFENALNYRDGIFELRSRIEVKGFIPNLAFESFKYFIKKIRKAGSAILMPLVPTFLFYNLFPVDVIYFAYASSYRNETTGIEYFCTTTIIKPLLPYRFISEPQFWESFGSLLDYKGNPLITAQPQSPSGGRPIVRTIGLIEIPLLHEYLPVKPGGI